MNQRPDKSDPDEYSIEQLLQGVGKRDLPSAEIMEQVREAVHGEWLELVGQRQRRSRFVGYAAAAGVAAIALAVTVSLQFRSGAAVPVASIARLEGVLQVDPAGSDDWHALASGEHVATGDTLRTDGGTRAALDFGHGISVRLDANSLLEIASADRIVLDQGSVYIDADPHVAAQVVQTLVVGTPYGSVHHLGTQYLVSTTRNGIELSVREGRVEITRESGTQTAQAGEHLSVAGSGEITRTSISPQDASWQWATRIAPAFDIDRQPLTHFLDWVARETGKRVNYATPAAQADAAKLILRGSAGDLAPEQALAAVLATTSFTHTETAAGIVISPSKSAP
ncbi:MAG TPA: FecR family protein [Steroidobacteraceae bacterium]|jgi:ferric-dicitrate binding protein FerR (iron transport regulator)